MHLNISVSAQKCSTLRGVLRGCHGQLPKLHSVTECGGLPLRVQALLGDETIANAPVLVLGNKIDRPEAVSEGGLRGAFALDGQVTGKVVITQQFSQEVHVIDRSYFFRGRVPAAR